MRLRTLASLSLFLLAATAAAAPPPEPESHVEARKEMRKGIDASAVGDHAEALTHYKRAAELVPDANLPHRYAAEALEGLQRWEEAANEYETYLRIKSDVRDADAVRKRVDEIRIRHLEGVLDVECEPSGAEVFLDKGTEPVGKTPLHGLRIRAGAHDVVVRAKGYYDGAFSRPVPAGGVVVVQCTLEREPDKRDVSPLVEVPPPPAERPQQSKSTPWYGQWWFWTAAAVVVGAGIGGTLLLTSGKNSPPASDGGNHVFP